MKRFWGKKKRSPNFKSCHVSLKISYRITTKKEIKYPRGHNHIYLEDRLLELQVISNYLSGHVNKTDHGVHSTGRSAQKTSDAWVPPGEYSLSTLGLSLLRKETSCVDKPDNRCQSWYIRARTTGKWKEKKKKKVRVCEGLEETGLGKRCFWVLGNEAGNVKEGVPID